MAVPGSWASTRDVNKLNKAISEMKPGEPNEIKLPTIKMTGIGKAQGGVTADVVAEEITHEMIAAVLNAAAKAGIKKSIEKQKTKFLDKLKDNNQGSW